MTSSTETTSSSARIAVNDIGDEEAFLAAIEGTIKEFNDGDIVEGVIVRVDRDEVLLDIGYKTEGVIPSRELSIKHDVDPNEVVKVGDEVEALVLQKEDKEGRLILSKKRAQYERAWGTIEKIKDEDGIVEGTVIEVVKGGLILDIGLRGFLPASLVEMRRVRDLQPYVGRKIEAKIIELDKNRNNVVLSRRAWLEQTQSEVRSEFLNQLAKGQVRDDAMVKIIDIDLDRRRISLSLKQANEGMTPDSEFDPTKYGMAAEYDTEGNYIYPEGFDVETQEWQEGFDAQRQEWEKQYAEAHERYEQHMRQIRKAAEADAAAAAAGDGP